MYRINNSSGAPGIQITVMLKIMSFPGTGGNYIEQNGTTCNREKQLTHLDSADDVVLTGV